nr:PREDICTED: transmembrane protein 59-like [Lepisosteus oculatus]
MVRHGGGVCGLPALVSVLLVGLTAASELFDNQLGDMNYCKQECNTKHKSSAKDAVLNACHRGCRLYSICQFVNGNAGYNASREECQGACQEAYVGRAEQEGCRTGCGSQPSDAESQRKRLRALAQRPQPSSSALDVLSTWCSDIISSAHSFISSTWTFYLQADDGKVVVFQVRGVAPAQGKPGWLRTLKSSLVQRPTPCGPEVVVRRMRIPHTFIALL